MLVDSEGNPVVDLGGLEPYKNGVLGKDGLIYPVLEIEYSAQSIRITWSKDDMETLKKRWSFDV